MLQDLDSKNERKSLKEAYDTILGASNISVVFNYENNLCRHIWDCMFFQMQVTFSSAVFFLKIYSAYKLTCVKMILLRAKCGGAYL